MSLTPSFVTFNVAGQRFTTSKDTLLKEPASRLAMLARGVLPAMKDDSGAIFLDRCVAAAQHEDSLPGPAYPAAAGQQASSKQQQDAQLRRLHLLLLCRDAKYFQMMLNYLRDGWCSLPSTANERRELLQEVCWYQLSSMEAWLKAQEVALTLNEAANLARPSSAPLDAFSRSSLLSAASSPVTPAQSLFAAANTSPFTVTTAVAGSPGFGSMYSSNPSPTSSPFRSNSFLTGANQDLLAAGALASCGANSSSLTSRHSTPSLLFGTQTQPLLFKTAGSGALGSKVSLVGLTAPVQVPGTGPEAAAAAGYVGAYQVAGAAANTAAASAGSPPRIPLPMVSMTAIIVLSKHCFHVLLLLWTALRVLHPVTSIAMSLAPKSIPTILTQDTFRR